MKNIEQVFVTVAVNEDIPIEIEAKKYYVKENIEGISKITENPHVEK